MWAAGRWEDPLSVMQRLDALENLLEHVADGMVRTRVATMKTTPVHTPDHGIWRGEVLPLAYFGPDALGRLLQRKPKPQMAINPARDPFWRLTLLDINSGKGFWRGCHGVGAAVKRGELPQRLCWGGGSGGCAGCRGGVSVMVGVNVGVKEGWMTSFLPLINHCRWSEALV